MNRVITLALIALATGMASALADEVPVSNAPVSSTTATRGVDLLSIISSVSQRTHKKFLLDPRVRAMVTLIGGDPHEVSYPMLLTILSIHGFFAYEREGVTVIAPDPNERQTAQGPGNADYVHAPDAEVVTAVIPLKNSRGNLLVPTLRPLMPQQANLGWAAEHNALVITDSAANVRRIVAIINDLDKLPIQKVESSQKVE